MDNFPAALVIASRQDVAHNNNVLFRLVRPMGSDLQSVDRMVNVVPYRRVYCFERASEVDDFRQEILRRPLILQPILHFGRGIGTCGACYNDEQWVVMVNQTHPKVLSRLQMGLDMAKAGIQRGQSVELKFRFGKAIERAYKKHLRQKEMGEATSSSKSCLAHFRFAEWEHADLTIRFHGYAAKLGRRSFKELENLKLNWVFEDIGMHEMVWNQLDGQTFTKPHLTPVSNEEVRTLLPAWTINSVSPLESIGDSVPQHTYSYAQAGRLYESFRKKKRQRDRAESGNNPSNFSSTQPAQRNVHTEEMEGAVGGEKPPGYECIQHDFSATSKKDNIPSRRRYQDYQSPPSAGYEHQRERTYSAESYDDHNFDRHNGDRYYDQHNSAQGYTDSPHPQEGWLPQSYSAGAQINVDVHSTSQYQNIPSPQAPIPLSPLSPQDLTLSLNQTNPADYYLNGLKKQDSDRSSQSTNADSGYHAEMDGVRSRGGSYDQNDGYGQKYVTVPQTQNCDKMPLRDMQPPHEGLENPGFQMDVCDADYAMRKHKELVAKVMQERNGPSSGMGKMDNEGPYGKRGETASSPRTFVMNSGPEPMADTFI